MICAEETGFDAFGKYVIVEEKLNYYNANEKWLTCYLLFIFTCVSPEVFRSYVYEKINSLTAADRDQE